jgi:hypothetical protein
MKIVVGYMYYGVINLRKVSKLMYLLGTRKDTGES